MFCETEWDNWGIKKDILFTNRNIYSIPFIEAKKVRAFFTQQSTEKDSNQRCEYTNIYK